MIDNDSNTHQSDWPDPLAPEAFNGPLGQLAKGIEPHTESDVAAVLIQLIVLFGNLVGHDIYYSVEGNRHAPNLFAVVVGISSKGRKGSSLGRALEVMKRVDPTLAERRSSGLSSGEGLIWAVRDKAMRVLGRTKDWDVGVEDKRLTVTEGEFASVLANCRRDGNVLSPVMRDAWDHGNLATLSKNQPAKATGAHISIIGHITRDELRRQLDSTELANGFANRFLWVCAKRSRLLPDGGNLDLDTLSDITDHLHQVVDCAHTVAASGGVKLARDDDARALWHSVYGDLSTGGLGLADAVTGRAEAQVLRLSCIYALADLSFVVCRQDLEAALAVWRYCEASARYVFGQAIGDPLADAIEAELHKAGDVGLTLTEINNEVGKRNILAYKITAALNLLQEHGRAYSEMDRTTGRGRKAERWFATKETKETKDTKDLSISEFDEQPTVASTGSALHG